MSSITSCNGRPIYRNIKCCGCGNNITKAVNPEGVAKCLPCMKQPLNLTHPQLSLEVSPASEISAEQCSKGSRSKVLWVCSKGHEWLARPKSRIEGKGCPECTKSTTSYTEIHLRTLLSNTEDYVTLPFMCMTFPTVKFGWVPITVDIVSFHIPTKSKLFIEFDGYWHTKDGKHLKDIEKTKLLLDIDPKAIVVRIRGKKVPLLDFRHERFIQIDSDIETVKDDFSEVVQTLSNKLIDY